MRDSVLSRKDIWPWKVKFFCPETPAASAGNALASVWAPCVITTTPGECSGEMEPCWPRPPLPQRRCLKSKRKAGWEDVQLSVHAVHYATIMNRNPLSWNGSYLALTLWPQVYQQFWDVHALKDDAKNISARLWNYLGFFLPLIKVCKKNMGKLKDVHDCCSAAEAEQSSLTLCRWGGCEL